MRAIGIVCSLGFVLCIGCARDQVRKASPHAGGAMSPAAMDQAAAPKPTSQAPAPKAARGAHPLARALAGISLPRQPTTPYERGQLQAASDLRHGVATLRTYGYPAASRRAYAKLLYKRFGVRLDAVAGCVVSTALIETARGYNKVVSQAIARLYGPNALKRASQDATRLTYGGNTP